MSAIVPFTYAVTLVGVALACALQTKCCGEDFALMCTVDYRSPVPPPLLKKGGIHTVYVYIGFPLKPDGTLDSKLKPQLDEFFKLYAEHSIKVLLVSNFYTRPPKGAEAVDASGRTLTMACLRNPDFLASMSREIKALAEAFGAYPAFAGFLFDDGVHVRVDACYCELCKRSFTEKYGIEPPAFEPQKGDPRLDQKDSRLLWDEFHRESYANYMCTQAQAASAVSDKLFCATIPSDSFYYGRHLNSEIAYDKTPLGGDARLMRIDRIQVRDWRIFQSFPVPLVVSDGEGLRPFATGCHLTEPSPKIILHTEGPILETAGRQQFLSPTEIGRMMRTTIAEGADRIGFWNNARVIADYPEGFDAVGAVAAEREKIQAILQERKPFPARVGLLYSTVTEVCQQPWQKNTLERWRHLHSFEAMAYALTRRSVQFRIVFDNELHETMLDGLEVLVLTGVTHLTKPIAESIEERIAAGKLRVITDRASLPLKGAKICNFDPDYWFNKQLKGYRQVRHLDHQATEIWKSVLPELDLRALQPVVMTDDSCFARIYEGKEHSLLIFVVNWDLWKEAKTRLLFTHPWKAKDEISGRALGEQESLELSVEPGGWLVLRCVSK